MKVKATQKVQQFETTLEIEYQSYESKDLELIAKIFGFFAGMRNEVGCVTAMSAQKEVTEDGEAG